MTPLPRRPRGRPPKKQCEKVVDKRPIKVKSHSFIIYDDLEFWAKCTGRKIFITALEEIRECRKKKIEPKVYWDKKRIVVEGK